MSLLRHLQDYPKLEKARYKPYLSLSQWDVAAILAEARNHYFPEIDIPIAISFVEAGPLCCIYTEPQQATLFIHQILNHWDTPMQVFSHICKHELLHLEIPPRRINGRLTHHPPEFWRRERYIIPERQRSWQWLWVNLADCLQQRPRLQQIDVLPGWKKRWGSPKRSLAECEALPLLVPVSQIELGF